MTNSSALQTAILSGKPGRRIDFQRIAALARVNALSICLRFLPDGRRHGHEWVARNPKRVDRRPGSFKVNLRTGRWADFASGDKGGDLISLVAFLFDLSQAEAARCLARMLSISSEVSR